MDRYLNRDTMLILAGNLLPLLGALVAGWDAFVLIVFYWCETAVIGFWVCTRIALGGGAATGFTDKSGRPVTAGVGLAIFLALHAGIFMAVHLVFILTLFGGGWIGRIDRPAGFVSEVIVGTGLWLPLAGLFLLRGLITLSEMSASTRTEPVVTGFYVRIVVMQFTVILAGFLALGIGGSLAGLVLLVAFKTIADLAAGPLAEAAVRANARARAERRRTP